MSINDDGGQRIIFPPGEQRKYLRAVRARLGLTSWNDLAAQCDCAKTTMVCWAAGRTRSMPARVVGILHRLSGITPPAGEFISATEFGRRQRQAGAQASTKEIRRPGRSPRLAEICAILLGDGGIELRHVRISNHAQEEREYAQYQAGLVAELFGLSAHIRKVKDCEALYVEVCSVELVRYLTSAEIGLHAGDKVKQQVGLPGWMAGGDYATRVATIRGLVDTDGCVFSCTDKQCNPPRHYVRLKFDNNSRPLVHGVGALLRGLDYPANVYIYEKEGYVRLCRQAGVRRYMREIGTVNRYRYECYLAAAGRARADGVRGWAGFSADEVLWRGGS